MENDSDILMIGLDVVIVLTMNRRDMSEGVDKKMRILTLEEAKKADPEFIYRINFLAIITPKEKDAWEKQQWKIEQKKVEKSLS